MRIFSKIFLPLQLAAKSTSKPFHTSKTYIAVIILRFTELDQPFSVSAKWEPLNSNSNMVHDFHHAFTNCEWWEFSVRRCWAFVLSISLSPIACSALSTWTLWFEIYIGQRGVREHASIGISIKLWKERVTRIFSFVLLCLVRLTRMLGPMPVQCLITRKLQNSEHNFVKISYTRTAQYIFFDNFRIRMERPSSSTIICDGSRKFEFYSTHAIGLAENGNSLHKMFDTPLLRLKKSLKLYRSTQP